MERGHRMREAASKACRLQSRRKVSEVGNAMRVQLRWSVVPGDKT